MRAETRLGVRTLEPDEMRRIARLAGAVLLVFALGNPYILVAVPGFVEHLGAYIAVGIPAFILGAGFVAASVAMSDGVLSRMFAPTGLVAFVYAAVATPWLMWSMGYPESGMAAIQYPITTILAFYLLTRWLALAIVGLMVAGQTCVEVASGAPWHLWVYGPFLTAVLLATGLFMGQLMSRLYSSERAARAAGAELADLNHNLEAKVAEQVGEVERLGRLRRFLSAPVAEAVLTSSDESSLAPHRREIAVLFCDLRGFTAFTKQVEPEEVMEVLDAYYAAAGEQITRFQATLGSFEGDGLMAYLNDPVPCDEPARRVVEMGLAISEAIDVLTPTWHRRGYDLSYGIGMALGHATLGVVGYDGRSDYTAMGTVVNLGSRLCSTANARELVVDRRVFLQTEDVFTFTRREPVMLKGFGEPVGNYLVDRT
jgi:adenylate cyclase